MRTKKHFHFSPEVYILSQSIHCFSFLSGQQMNLNWIYTGPWPGTSFGVILIEQERFWTNNSLAV